MFENWQYWAHYLQQVPAAYIIAYALIINALTASAYYMDKRAAINQTWRIPESTLHMLMLMGGTFGALYGQKKLRHKNRKRSFQAVFWGLVVLQAIIIAFLLNA